MHLKQDITPDLPLTTADATGVNGGAAEHSVAAGDAKNQTPFTRTVASLREASITAVPVGEPKNELPFTRG